MAASVPENLCHETGQKDALSRPTARGWVPFCVARWSFAHTCLAQSALEATANELPAGPAPESLEAHTASYCVYILFRLSCHPPLPFTPSHKPCNDCPPLATPGRPDPSAPGKWLCHLDDIACVVCCLFATLHHVAVSALVLPTPFPPPCILVHCLRANLRADAAAELPEG